MSAFVMLLNCCCDAPFICTYSIQLFLTAKTGRNTMKQSHCEEGRVKLLPHKCATQQVLSSIVTVDQQKNPCCNSNSAPSGCRGFEFLQCSTGMVAQHQAAAYFGTTVQQSVPIIGTLPQYFFQLGNRFGVGAA